MYISSASNALIYALSAGDAINIQYPIEALGSCASESDCRQYCNQPDHTDACLDFAVQKGLMSADEVAVARKFLRGEVKGPGGCTDKESCQSYCEDISKINECVAFVEENNLLSPNELQEFKQVQAAIERGVTPPPCTSRQSCEAYCEEPSNMEVCIKFGVEAGFLQGKEKEDAQKMLEAVKRGVTPPPCRGREQCETFCSAPENMEQCMNFAIEAGFMPPEEVENAKKMLAAFKNGVKPLSCKSKEECDAYCSTEEHREECFTFAESAGMMTAEEAALARKTGGKGPGGCMGREECEAFCQGEANREICYTFAKENGMISENDMHFQEGGPEGQEGQGDMTNYSNMPVPPCQTQEECEKLRQEMMNQQNISSQYEGQYPEQYKGEMQLPPEQYAPSPESFKSYEQPPSDVQYHEPTSSITHQLLGALLNLALGLFYR